MDFKEIIKYRLFNHQIASTAFTQPEELLRYYAAMQSQDWSMAKWAFGLRLQHIREKDIEKLFNEGKILRTHVLRPTWHFVLPEDIRWLLQVTSKRVHQANGLYYRKFDLNPKVISKSEKIISKALEGNQYCTREELNSLFEKAKISGERMRHIYLIMHAELEGLICSGPRRGKQFTYALLEERAPKVKNISAKDALQKLAHLYFTSRGPATVHDFSWWSGLTVKDAKQGIESLDDSFTKEIVNGQEFIFQPKDLPDFKNKQTTFLMPDYDEYGIGYKNREMYQHPVWSKKEKLATADYFHAIVVDGYFGGTWTKKTIKNKLVIDIKPFKSISVGQNKKLKRALEVFYRFGM